LLDNPGITSLLTVCWQEYYRQRVAEVVLQDGWLYNHLIHAFSGEVISSYRKKTAVVLVPEELEVVRFVDRASWCWLDLWFNLVCCIAGGFMPFGSAKQFLCGVNYTPQTIPLFPR
jgi:hypothetical protein